jgi:hypothetical protein
VDGLPVLSQASRWTPTGFLRRASGAWGAIESRLWMPLDESALLLEVDLTAADLTAAEHAAQRPAHGDEPLVLGLGLGLRWLVLGLGLVVSG